jgi:hypothetical protein
VPSGATTNALPGIQSGDVVYVVEAFYNYQSLFGGLPFGLSLAIPTVGPTMYAAAYF